MAKLVIIKNPFEPWNGRIVKDVAPGVSLKELIGENAVALQDLSVTVNAQEVHEDTVINDTDFIVISPVVGKGNGNKILGVVAAVALTVATGAAGAAFAKTLATGAKVWTIGSYIAAATVMFLGSSLVNRLLGTNLDLGSYGSYDNNPTYSWGGVQTMEGQNNPISLTYGKVLSAGQTIGKYVDVKNDDEYLNWLIAAGEGPLTIADVKLNDNAIEYYSNCEMELREGTNTQDVISNFNDTYFTKSLGYELTDQDRIDTCQGNGTEGIKVKIEFSNGLYYAADDGSLSNAWVQLEIRYRKGSTGAWNILDTPTVSGNQSSALRKEYRVDNLPAGVYQVSVKVLNRSHKVTNSRASVKCYWSELTSIVYDDFAYPNIALIGLKIKASSQISGNPSISFIKEREKVWVWNPYTVRYESRSANNPAWAAYDVLHQAAYLQNPNTSKWEYDVRGVPAEHLVYDHFNEWATFCEDKELYVNIELNSLGEMLEVVNTRIANVGRGRVVRFGTRYGCVWDCAKAPVQMFGMGNIIAGTFAEEFMQKSDRANCVEITYMDAANGYNRETITIYSDTYDTDSEEKTAQATFDGITSYEQAYREGMYQLYSNKYLVRTISFEANIDAISCTVGDVVMVAHDVPMWAKSGRIEGVDGQVLTLPVELASASEQYRIMYRTVNDNMYTSNVDIVDNADGWCKVRVLNLFQSDDLPQKGDVFDLAIANIGSKPFVVKSILRAQDFTRKIECLEYNENIYNENYDIPVIEYSVNNNKIENVKKLVASSYRYIDADGSTAYRIDCSWVRTSIGDFIIYLSDDGLTWSLLAGNIQDTSYAANIPANAKYVKVVTSNGAALTDGLVAAVENKNNDIAGLDVANLTAESKYREYSDGSSGYDIIVSFTTPKYAEAVEVFYKTDGMAADDVATFDEGVVADEAGYSKSWRQAGEGISGVTISQATLGDTYMIKARGRSSSGLYSSFTDVVYCAVKPKGTLPSQPYNLTCDFTESFRFTWNDVTDSDVVYYELRTNQNVGSPDGLLGRTKDCCLEVSGLSRNGKAYLYSVNSQKVASYPAEVSWKVDEPVAPILTFSETPRGMNITAENMPKNAKSITLSISASGHSESIESYNATYTFTSEPNIYEVTAHYSDLFGAGKESPVYTFTINPTFNEEWIADGSITSDKVSQAIQNALQDVSTSKADIVEINQTMEGISSSVVSLASSTATSIKQNADSITSIVTTLNDPEQAKSYSAIAQLDEAIGLRVEKDGVINAINMSPEGTTIDGKYLHVTGKTLFDDDVEIKGMLKANSITAEMIQLGAVTSEKIEDGAVSGGKIAAGAVSAEKMSVESLSAVSAVIGTLRTKTTGARVEISDNLIKVYDENNTLRVRLGVW